MANNPNNTAKMVKLSKTQLDQIASGNSITSGTDSYSADLNTVYMVESNASIKPYTLTVGNWSNNQYTLTITDKQSWNDVKIYKNSCLLDGNNQPDIQATLTNSNNIDSAGIAVMIDNGTSITLVCQNTPTTDLYILVEVCD